MCYVRMKKKNKRDERHRICIMIMQITVGRFSFFFYLSSSHFRSSSFHSISLSLSFYLFLTHSFLFACFSQFAFNSGFSLSFHKERVNDLRFLTQFTLMSTKEEKKRVLDYKFNFSFSTQLNVYSFLLSISFYVGFFMYERKSCK
jgi:hypothetical protein